MPSTTYPHAEERSGTAGARLEARTALNAAHSCLASAIEPSGIEVPDAADDEFRVVVFWQKLRFAE
jgi:hypothetical protein